MPQAIVAQLVKSLRQDMLEKAAHELLAGEGGGSVAVGGAILVAEGDACLVDADDPSVGDGDAQGIAGEVIEHRLSLAPGGDMDDPWCAPGVGRQADVQTKLAERVTEAGADQLADRLARKHEILLGRMPAATGIVKPAARDQCVPILAVVQRVRP